MALELNFPPVSFLQFWVTFAILLMLTFFITLYMMIFVWHFGKPMRKYLTARLSPGMGIIQEYAHETVNLILAKVYHGEFIDTETQTFTEELPKKKWWHIWWHLGIGKYRTITKHSKPLISKSIVSINGVQTLLVWNVNPPLPERYLKALESLIKLGYNSTDDIKNDMELEPTNAIPNTGTVYGNIQKNGLTFQDFLELHELLRNKNSISVTPDDILSFSDKYLDEHPRESVVEREVVVNRQRHSEHKYQTYAFMLIGLEIIFGFIVILYKIKTGGG